MNVFERKVVSACLCSLLLFVVTCNNPNNPDDEPEPTIEAAEIYGAIQINLKENSKTVDFLSTCKDSATPGKLYDTVLTEGTMHLHVTTYPFCEDCGWNHTCLADDICVQDPQRISIGTITVTGAKDKQGADPFDIEEIGKRHNASLSYPPFNEGDVVTITVAGVDTVPPFTLQAVGVAPLELLNELPIPCGEGQDIELKWTPPSKDIGSKIRILIDVSYHGGSKAQIVGECDDDGSQVISGQMLDQLKSYGLAGFPRLDMKRITKGTNAETKVEFTIESNLSVFLDIPGLVSCNENEECPNGSCVDRRCQ